MAGGPSLRAFTNVLIAEAQFPPEQWEDNSGPSGRLHGASGKQDSSHYTGPRSGRREGKLCMKNPSKPWTPSAPEHLHRQDLQPFWQKGASERGLQDDFPDSIIYRWETEPMQKQAPR